MATFTSSYYRWWDLERILEQMNAYEASSSIEDEMAQLQSATSGGSSANYYRSSATTLTASFSNGATSTISGSGFGTAQATITRIELAADGMRLSMAGSVGVDSASGEPIGSFSTLDFESSSGVSLHAVGSFRPQGASTITRSSGSLPLPSGRVTFSESGFATNSAAGETERITALSVADASGSAWSISGLDYVVPNPGADTDYVAQVQALLAGNDLVRGAASAQELRGFGGNDTLDGGADADTLAGGLGNDTYIVDDADTVVEGVGEGTDLIRSSISRGLEDNVENLTLTGLAALNGYGNESANRITGNAGANHLDGGSGDDTLAGGAGNDSYSVDDAGDVVTEAAAAGTDSVITTLTAYTLSANVENLTLYFGALRGTGNGLANLITASSGGGDANTLNGGAGIDTLVGGDGDDRYVVDHARDVVTELADEGIDTVVAAATYTLTANLENLTLTGAGAFNATGNALDNVLTGNAGNNLLDGGVGADTLSGGAGNDSYVVDDAGDAVGEESAGRAGGTDLVRSSISFALGPNFEHLILLGTANIDATGNELANALTGNDGDNLLDGGLGNDTLQGGRGNDRYRVDSLLDRVVEAAVPGTDEVEAAVNWTLGANLENLTLTGSAAINGIGNALANVLAGNAGNNLLDGRGGADRYAGGLGDDTYVLDQALELAAVTEDADAGTDLLRIAYANSTRVAAQVGLSGNLANIENVRIEGAGLFRLTGNDFANALTGNGAANTLTGAGGNDSLDGGAGIDTLVGGAGDDSYRVDNPRDLVTELESEGTDTVLASAACTLAAHLENLTLTGTAAINGTGNDLDNALTGNAAANLLAGGAGNDVLRGGGGQDRYSGGTGADSFLIERVATLVAVIGDFSAAEGDRIGLAGTAYAGLFDNGTLRADVLGSGTAFPAANAAQRLLYNAATGGLWFDRDGRSGAAAAVQIARLTNRPADLAADAFLAAG